METKLKNSLGFLCAMACAIPLSVKHGLVHVLSVIQLLNGLIDRHVSTLLKIFNDQQVYFFPPIRIDALIRTGHSRSAHLHTIRCNQCLLRTCLQTRRSITNNFRNGARRTVRKILEVAFLS